MQKIIPHQQIMQNINQQTVIISIGSVIFIYKQIHVQCTNYQIDHAVQTVSLLTVDDIW